jgi:hypothetical protein
MALVGEVTAAAPTSARCNVYCGARSQTRPGPKDARVDRRRDAERRKVGIEVIRSVAKIIAQSDGRLRQARSQGAEGPPWPLSRGWSSYALRSGLTNRQ